MKRFIITLIICLTASSVHAGPGHNRMVRRTGIVPNRIGSYEGVGRSPHSFADAQANACYAGQRTVASVQYSTSVGRGGKTIYNAVVRYW